MPATVLCFIIINSCFLLFSILFDVSRPWINIDYAFALMFFVFGQRWLGIIALAFFLTVDVLAVTAQIFPFPRIADLFYLLKFSFLASWFHLSMLMAVLMLAVLKLSSFIVLSKYSTKKYALISLNILLILQAFFVYTADSDSSRNTYRKTNSLPVSSQLVNFVEMRSHRFLSFFESDQPILQPRNVSATEPWFVALANNDIQNRLLLVVVESWGDPVNPAIQEALLSPLEKIPNTLFDTGVIRASGMTLEGELRELCRLRTTSFNLAKLEHGFENCLGNQLLRLGYTSGAMHGATGMMYDRRHWYPRAGFQEALFFENRIWPRRCFSFPGACDLDMFDDVIKFFDAPGQRFFYWLTLNTHARYDARDIDEYKFDCEVFNVSASSESCRNFVLHAQFFSGLADALKTEAMSDVEVILVSDHSPILMSGEEKRQNFVEDSLPWVRIRGSGGPTLP